MSKGSVALLDSFHQKLNILDRIRNKQENLVLSNQIVIRDIEEVYGSIFLNAIASFEGFLEDLFVGLLVRQTHISRCNVRVGIQSYLVAREVIFKGRQYFNWLPYQNTKGVAKVFFTGGRPFTLLTSDEEEHLNSCLVIRNAIAHESRYAIDAFEKKVLTGLTLGPRDKRPKSLLRSQFSMVPPNNYYQQYISKILTIASRLC